MKRIKIKLGETFELIIIDNEGIEMAKKCYYFDPDTEIRFERDKELIIQMDIVPTIDYSKLFCKSKLFDNN